MRALALICVCGVMSAAAKVPVPQALITKAKDLHVSEAICEGISRPSFGGADSQGTGQAPLLMANFCKS